MNFDIQEYERIEPFFERGDVNCAFIARETGLSPGRVVKYYSAYLRSVIAKNKLRKKEEILLLFEY